MRAWAPRRPGKPAKRRTRKRALITRTTPPPPPPSPPLRPDIHYEAGWTDSWSHRRCEHQHQTLIEAARCGAKHGCGWYVFCVEKGIGHELREAEDEVVNRYRFET